MMRIVLIVFLTGLTSCGIPKGVAKGRQPENDPNEETHQTTEPVNEAYLLGEVQLLDCGVVIQITSGEKKTICTPTNLDPKFQVDKLRLKLKFKVLDQKATTCSEFPAIEITEVFAVR